MKIILPTSYFPPIEHFVCLLNTDEIIIEKHEYYVKQTFRNRMNIYGPNGLLSLSIPVTKINGNKTLIKNISISNHSNWQTIHWRSIETTYNSSPFFLYYKDDVFPFFNQKYENLFNYNFLILQTLFDLMDIKKNINLTEIYHTPQELKFNTDILDLRNSLSSNHQIIKSSHQFSSYFQVFNHKHGFIPNLSILDLLFNLGPSSLEYLANSNFEILNK